MIEFANSSEFIKYKKLEKILPKIEVILTKSLVPVLLIDPGMLKVDSNEYYVLNTFASSQTYACISSFQFHEC